MAAPVDGVTVGVRVARHVQPLEGHPLAEAWRREQPIDDRGVGVGGVVREERVDLLRRRRKPGQVEGHPPEERVPVGLRRRLQPRGLQLTLDEGVDSPGGVPADSRIRALVALRCTERPVLTPGRTRRDPALEDADLVLTQRGLALGRHRVEELVPAVNPREQLALPGRRAIDHRVAATISDRVVLEVKPQAALARRGVRPMALEAMLGEDRPDVTREVHLRQRSGGHLEEAGEE